MLTICEILNIRKRVHDILTLLFPDRKRFLPTQTILFLSHECLDRVANVYLNYLPFRKYLHFFAEQIYIKYGRGDYLSSYREMWKGTYICIKIKSNNRMKITLKDDYLTLIFWWNWYIIPKVQDRTTSLTKYLILYMGFCTEMKIM